MRGVGGILINDKGERFCNELGTRAYVTDQMLSHNPEYAKSRTWNVEAPIPTFSLVLSSSAASDGKKHVDLYTHKGLLTKLEGLTALAQWMQLSKSVVETTLRNYHKAAKSGSDEFGKTTFRGVADEDLESEIFYAGTITPVLHYCMGGITIDTEGSVLGQGGQVIPGLHAAGEVTGGVHGVNRLAGNSLLECTVYGTVVGQKIPIRSNQADTMLPPPTTITSSLQQQQQPPPQRTDDKRSRLITTTELAKHNTPDDCWVAIYGTVYDLTSFAEEHPAGPESIHVLGGKDGSSAFEAMHNQGILEEVEDDIVGQLQDDDETDDDETTNENAPVAAASSVDQEDQQQQHEQQQQADNNRNRRGLLSSLVGLK